jgi:aminoglycoside 3-N-acetyltransferase
MKKILEYFPWVEAIGRNIYWRSTILQNLGSRLGKGRTVTEAAAGFSIDELILTLRNMGIAANDVVIVHSSMKELAGCGLGANRIIESFMRQLCPGGTLVCPTFPLYANEPHGKERLTKDMSNVELVYNVQKSRPWTGELGRALMRMPGARRSLHPLNTIAAYGAAVDQIFENEIMGSLDLPCGPDSTWAALAELNAKIVMLGVDLTHSLTMIHVAEDCHETQWPVKGWYRKRVFRIIDGSKENRVEVRERHPRWALSYAERKLSRDLYVSGTARRGKVGNLDVTVLESGSLLRFLDRRKQSGYPYYLTWLSRL